MEIGTPSVQAGTEGLSASERSAQGADAFLADPGVALWVGFGGFLFILFLVMFLIIRGRVIRPARARAEKQSTFFEPAGEGAEITFEDPAEDQPPARKSKKDKKPKKRWGREKPAAPAPEPEPAPTPEIEAEEDEVYEDTRAGLDRRPAPFAGIFENREQAPETQDARPAGENEYEGHAAAARRRHDGGDLDIADMERERREQEEREEMRRREEEEAEERARLEYERAEYEREETRRRADAEARARQDADERDRIYLAAREDAAREAEFERRKAEAALEQRMQSVAAMQRKLAEKAETLKSDAESVSNHLGATLEERFATLAADLDARLADASASQSDTEALAAAFADRLDREVGDMRAATGEAIDSLSARIDKLSAAQEQTGVLARELARLNTLLAERSAGAGAGQVELPDLVRSALPAGRYIFSKKLSTGRDADCLITMPGLAAPVAVDASYPVAAFEEYARAGVGDEKARGAYQRAALRHIVDVAENLIEPGETADFAILFTPSEAIFNDLHTNFADLVQDSYRARVWILSPTSMMSSLHMMSAVSNATSAGPDLNKLEARIAALESGGTAKPPAPSKQALSPEEEAFERLQKQEAIAEDEEKTAPASTKPPFPLR